MNVYGETYQVTPRHVAEQIINEVSSEHLVSIAYSAADTNHDGIAALDLTTGEILSHNQASGVPIPFYTVSSSEHDTYNPPVIDNIIAGDEADAALAHANEGVEAAGYATYDDIDEVPPEALDAYLQTRGSSCNERLTETYVHEHGLDADGVSATDYDGSTRSTRTTSSHHQITSRVQGGRPAAVGSKKERKA